MTPDSICRARREARGEIDEDDDDDDNDDNHNGPDDSDNGSLLPNSKPRGRKLRQAQAEAKEHLRKDWNQHVTLTQV